MLVRRGRAFFSLATLFAYASCAGPTATRPRAPVAPNAAPATTSNAAPNAAPSAAPTTLAAAPNAAPNAALAAAPNAASLTGASGAPRPWPPPAPTLRSDWCIEGVAALDEATCYVLPDAPTDVLLIYLHGIVPPGGASAQKTNLQRVVANATKRARVAALLPRGEQGLGPKGQERWWSWPTGESSYRRRSPALVAAIAEGRRRLEALTGVAFARVYVAGSSAGAYFVSELALHGGLHADGFAAVSGGAARPTAEFAALPPTAFYIGYGTYDPAAASARALGAQLRRAGWPLRVATHPVPHGAHEVYLDEAFAFWREAAPSPGGKAARGAPDE